MRLNVINLIENFNKFNNCLSFPKPLMSHKGTYPNFNSCTDFLDYTQNTLIFESKPLAAIKLFNILLEKGKKGIIITRNHPDKLVGAVPTNNLDMYWFSTEDFDYVIHPWDISSLFKIVKSFVNKNNQGIILLNGLEYLSTYNNNNILFNLVSSMSRLVSNSNAKFFLSIDPIAIGNQFLVTIQNRSELIPIPSNSFKEVLM
jgi:hypothetical protein